MSFSGRPPPGVASTLPPSGTDLAVGVEGERVEDAGSSGVALLPARLSRYGIARQRAVRIMQHLNALRNTRGPVNLEGRTADRLKHCGEYLGFHHYFTVGELRLTKAEFCRQHLVCPLCAIRRGSKMVSAYLDRFDAINLAHPGLVPFHIVYTVKNGPDLAERMEHLRNGLSVLVDRRRCALKGKRGRTEWRRIHGAVWAIETTHNPETGWHPHAHMIALADSHFHLPALRAEWRGITGDSHNVHVQHLDRSRPVADAFVETFKYALKFSDLPIPLAWEAAKRLSGQRLVSSVGSFRGVDVPEELTDQPLDGLPFVEIFARYLGGKHYGIFDRRK